MSRFVGTLTVELDDITSCWGCPAKDIVQDDVFCTITNTNLGHYLTDLNRPTDCPLKEVKEDEQVHTGD